MPNSLCEKNTDSKKKLLNSEEFVSRILSGERNFNNLNLEENSDLRKVKDNIYKDFLKYLSTKVGKKKPIQLNGAIMKGLIAPNIILKYVEAEGIDLSNAILTEANLAHAYLRGASLKYMKGRKCTLIKADLHAAFMHESDFTEANLRGAYLHGAILLRTNFTSAVLKKVDLDRVYAKGANFSKANLENSTLTRGNFEMSSFSEAKLAGIKSNRSIGL